jgi:hypothetical protein
MVKVKQAKKKNLLKYLLYTNLVHSYGTVVIHSIFF